MLRKQSGCGKNLETTFGYFKKSVEKLNDSAKLSLHEMSKDSNTHIRKSRLEQAQNTKALANIDSDLQEVRLRYEKLDSQLERHNRDVQHVKLQQERMMAMQDMANTLLEQLKCNPKLQELRYTLQQQRRATVPVNRDFDDHSDEDFAFPQIKAPPILHRAALQHHIDHIFLNQARRDIQAASSSGCLMSFEEQDRQAYMNESSTLHRFLAAASSSITLIQGNSPHDDNIASTSVYAAILAFTLQKIQVPVLYFACGLHRTPYVDDSFLGPYGMMLGLLQQLLDIYRHDHLTFFKQNPLHNQFSSVESIGYLMQTLVSNEPRATTTFCIVDGISFFENSTCEAQTHEAIAQLLRLVLASSGCFKLLFTSPTRSIYVPLHLWDWPGLHDVLDVPSDIVHGRRQGVRPQALQYTMSDSLLQPRRPLPWSPALEQRR